MDIFKAGSRPTKRAPADYFVGEVLQDAINEAPEPARVRQVRVTFMPGARTNWHTHPYGQTLYVLSGVGRVQVFGGPVREIRPGDSVWFPPGEKHWHGAAPDTMMCHIATQEALNGVMADWMEPVTDAQYTAKPEA